MSRPRSALDKPWPASIGGGCGRTPDVGGQEFGLFEGGEVAAVLVFGPLHDVVGLLGDVAKG
jgi:hypothetical protein